MVARRRVNGRSCRRAGNRTTPTLLLVSCLLISGLLPGRVHGGALAGRPSDDQLGRRNTWSARSSTGGTLSGTWTADSDPAPGTATGTWTVLDANGKTVARGGWSAAKSPKGWTGAWRAIVSGSKQEYSGTWSADVDLQADARFEDLFEMAAKEVVSGSWRAGGQSGAWSIRAYE